MPKNVAEINYAIMRDSARNWANLLATLTAAGWEIEPGTTGTELAEILIALVESANADEEAGPDPLVQSLAWAYAAYGLDEPPLEPGIHPAHDRNEIADTVAARHPSVRWGLQWPDDEEED